jgi:hypothetical protein
VCARGGARARAARHSTPGLHRRQHPSPHPRPFAGDARKNRATTESVPGALNASRHANAVVKRKSTPSGRCSARRGVSAILRRRSQHRHRKGRGARTRCSSRAPGRGRPRRSTARRPRLRAGAMGLHERAWRVGRATAHTLADSWGRATSISMHARTGTEVALTSSPSTPHTTLDELVSTRCGRPTRCTHASTSATRVTSRHALPTTWWERRQPPARTSARSTPAAVRASSQAYRPSATSAARVYAASVRRQYGDRCRVPAHTRTGGAGHGLGDKAPARSRETRANAGRRKALDLVRITPGDVPTLRRRPRRSGIFHFPRALRARRERLPHFSS